MASSLLQDVVDDRSVTFVIGGQDLQVLLEFIIEMFEHLLKFFQVFFGVEIHLFLQQLVELGNELCLLFLKLLFKR